MTTKRPEMKRFYKDVTVFTAADGFQIHLDDRPVRTRRRNTLNVSSKALAEAIVMEWAEQGDEIGRVTMPLTALSSISCDAASSDNDKWRDAIIEYLKSDLLCYRADAPAVLAARQNDVWNPYLDWFAARFGAPLKTTAGVVATEQPECAVASVRDHLGQLSTEIIFAVHQATHILGSAVLAVALSQEWKSADELFAASRVDEDFQAEKWGVDSEAKDRAALIRQQLYQIEKFLALLRSPT